MKFLRRVINNWFNLALTPTGKLGGREVETSVLVSRRSWVRIPPESHVKFFHRHSESTEYTVLYTRWCKGKIKLISQVGFCISWLLIGFIYRHLTNCNLPLRMKRNYGKINTDQPWPCPLHSGLDPSTPWPMPRCKAQKEAGLLSPVPSSWDWSRYDNAGVSPYTMRVIMSD